MSNFNLFPDANFLVFLIQSANQNGGIYLLDNIIPQGGRVIITKTVRDEVNMQLHYSESTLFFRWIGSRPEVYTEFNFNLPPGDNNGELTISLAVQDAHYASDTNHIISSDNRWDWELNIPEEVTRNDSIGGLSSLLIKGLISYDKYVETVLSLEGYVPYQEYYLETLGGPVPFGFVAPGNTYILESDDGLEFSLRVVGTGQPGQTSLMIYQNDVPVGAVGPHQSFTLSEAGVDIQGVPHCFAAGTMIDMWPLDPTLKPGADGHYDQKAVRAGIWRKPIEEVRATDTVVSFDTLGKLVPGHVTRTMTNDVKIILDFHGTFVTPGHVYWCAGGRFAGRYAPLIDILRDDGVIQHQDGRLIRAATGCDVGSPDDEEFWAFKLYTDDQGNERVQAKTKLRFGTRWMMPNGHHFSMRDFMEHLGVTILRDGPYRGYARWQQTGHTMPFAWVLSDSLPNPEDFVLARSGTSLQDIYTAGQWEAVRPAMPPPRDVEGRPVQPLVDSKLELLRRNEPMAFRSDAPSSEILPGRDPQENRRQRRSAEARARQAARSRHRRSTTLH